MLARADASPRQGTSATARVAGPRGLVAGTAVGAWRRVLPGLAGITVHQVCEIAVPVVVGLVIDRGIVAHDPLALWTWIGVLVGLFLTLALAFQVGILFGLRGMEEAHHGLRMRTTWRMLDPRGFGDRPRSAGELLGIGGTDVQTVSGGVMLLVFPIAELAAVIVAGIVLVGISWPLGVAVIAGGPVFLLLLDRVGRALRQRAEAEQQVTADAATLAADVIGGFRTLSALGATTHASTRYRAASGRALDAAIAARRTEAWFVALSRIATGGFVAGIGIAAVVMAIGGSITVGQLITVVGVVQVVMGPLQALAVNVGATWARATASATRVLSLLHAPPAHDVDGAISPVQGAGIRVRDVVGEHVRGVSLDVAPGEVVGVVADAPTAAELVALLGGTRAPDTGTVHVDGHDLAALPARLRHEHVVAAPHAAHAIAGSVARNVLGRASGDPLPALAAAAFDDALATLPSGTATDVGPSGRSLSGGQRQRLALARAYAAPAAALVLHDPTTAVDAVTELRIAERMREAVAGRAVVLVCSTPQLLARADRVVVLEDGLVAATDRHEALMAANATYVEAVS